MSQDILDFPMNIAEARQVLREGRPRHSTAKLVIASHKMMDACRRETGEVTIDDAFRCLSYTGAIATVGARCLYVLTGRDGLGWNPGPFVWDRVDWESYLRQHHPNSLERE